jgi:hypothetical protein
VTGTLILSVAALVAACGGSTGSASPSGPAGTASSATATPAASAPAASSDASAPAIALPSFDIGSLTQGLANVDSYKVAVTLKGEDVLSGTVVTKPVLARDLTIKGGTHLVIIGDEAWAGQAGAPLTSMPGQLATGLFAAFDPTLLVGAFSGPQWAQSSLAQGTEDKNGVSAKKYHLDSATAAAGFTGIPAGASMDLWIADEGYLVAVEATGFPQGDFAIQVTGVDDPANKVERPS